MPVRMALEDMNLAEWYALTHTFALLVSLTDVEDMKTYLARLEDAGPFKDKDSKWMCNDCIVHWEKVPGQESTTASAKHLPTYRVLDECVCLCVCVCVFR